MSQTLIRWRVTLQNHSYSLKVEVRLRGQMNVIGQGYVSLNHYCRGTIDCFKRNTKRVNMILFFFPINAYCLATVLCDSAPHQLDVQICRRRRIKSITFYIYQKTDSIAGHEKIKFHFVWLRFYMQGVIKNDFKCVGNTSLRALKY